MPIATIKNQADKDALLTDREKFDILLNNMWYTWNPHYILPIIDLYGDGWRKNAPPANIIANYGQEKLAAILKQKQNELTDNLHLYREYFAQKTWFESQMAHHKQLKKLIEHPIAYFCMEYALADWLQIYSGGLGVLAGDYLKQASDSGLPLIGVGIFYHEGYFHQNFTDDGKQVEEYIHHDPLDFPMQLVRNPDGTELNIDLIIGERQVYLRAWKLKIGRTDLILMDTNFDKNDQSEDRMLTAHLYGGDAELRIKQEMILGIGGTRMLKAMRISPAIYHMNEGHSAFLIIEKARQLVSENNSTFAHALVNARQSIVFTNHTLRPSGNDIFDYYLFGKYFTIYAKELKTDLDTLFNLGREEGDIQGNFSMTVFALRFSKVANAVSKIHSEAAKKIWPLHHLIAITNGVHMPTWIATEIHMLLEEFVGKDWHNPNLYDDYRKVQTIPPQLLWKAHLQRKTKLILSLNSQLGLNLSTEALTIAWSRRLTSYKRPDLIMSDLKTLQAVVSGQDRPVQILIAGKAHPQDDVSKLILQNMNKALLSEEFKNKVVVIPGYNWQLARRMVSGADVWLNTPYRYEEASGTSGMKAAANGVLQFTTLDGWTDEVEWNNTGWVIGEKDPDKALYEILNDKIIPLFFAKNAAGYNEKWVSMMLNSIELVFKRYSTERMLKEYIKKIYSKIDF